MGIYVFIRTRWRIIAAGVLLAALLVACARTDIQSSSNYPETMSVWLQWDLDPAAFQTLFDDFGDAHDTLVEVALRVHADKITNGIQSDDPPDVMILRPSQMVDFANQRLLTPLDDVIAKQGINLDDIYPAALNLCKYRGRFYCLPWSTYTFALMWNKDLFRAAGLNPNKPPETLEELESYADQLTRFDDAGNIVQLGFLPNYPGAHNELFVRVFGGYWYNEDLTRVTLASLPEIKTMTWQQRFYRRYGTEKVVQFRSTLGHYASPDHGFLTGKLAMVVDGQWMLGPDFIQKYKPDLNFGVAPFPYPQDHPERRNTSVVIGSVAVIPAGTKNIDAAGALLAWMLRPDFQAKFNCQSFNLPVNIQAMSDPCFQKGDKFKVYMDLATAPNARGQVVSPISDELSSELRRIEKLVLDEEADPFPLLREAQVKLQFLLDATRCETENCK